MIGQKRFIVFTDLDGTLLSRTDFQWKDAETSLEKLKANGVPVVFCSSKTLAEQLALQHQMKINDPMIVENGSAVVFSTGQFCKGGADEFGPAGCQAKIFGLDSKIIKSRLTSIRDLLDFPFKCYFEMTDSEINHLTGLSGIAIEHARCRDFSETIHSTFTREQQNNFERALLDFGLTTRSGGHLQTVTAAGCDKGRAAKYVIDNLFNHSSKLISIGIGDSPNDVDFLKIVDHAFQVQTPGRKYNNLPVDGLIRIDAIGPIGWSKAIEKVLPKLL